MTLQGYLVTDGDNWIRVSQDELTTLLDAGAIVQCDSLQCPTGTYHPMNSWMDINNALRSANNAVHDIHAGEF